MFIPKHWLHCVRSSGNPNTLALSFQVEFDPDADTSIGAMEDLREKIWNPMGHSSSSQKGNNEEKAELVAAIKGSGMHGDQEDCALWTASKPDTGSSSAWNKKKTKTTKSMATFRLKKSPNNDSKGQNSRWNNTNTKNTIKGMSNFGLKKSPGSIKSEHHRSDGLPWLRKSTRQRFKCGICSSNGFVGDGHVKEEMWMLLLQGAKQPPHMATCPTEIPQHLVCFKCCPRNQEGIIEPEEVITYPGGERRPILTMDEFCKITNMKKSCFKLYAYVTGSDIDYSSKIMNQGQALFGDAGFDYDACLAEMTMIKPEF